MELVSGKVVSQKIRKFKGSMRGRTWTVSPEGVGLYDARYWSEDKFEEVIYDKDLHKKATDYFG
jgi:hypothetical protein